MCEDQQLPGTCTSSATQLGSALTGLSWADLDAFPPALLSWDYSGGDLHLLDKIGNFWVLQLTVLSLVNRSCKRRGLVVALNFMCNIVFHRSGLDKALRCVGLKVCQKRWQCKSSTLFSLSHWSAIHCTSSGNASRLGFQFRTHLNCLNI